MLWFFFWIFSSPWWRTTGEWALLKIVVISRLYVYRMIAFHFLFCFFAPFSSILSVFVFSSLASQYNIITRHFHCQSTTLPLTRTHWVFCYFRTFWIIILYRRQIKRIFVFLCGVSIQLISDLYTIELTVEISNSKSSNCAPLKP